MKTNWNIKKASLKLKWRQKSDCFITDTKHLPPCHILISCFHTSVFPNTAFASWEKDESLFLFASRHWRLWWRCQRLQPLTLLLLLLDQSADRSCHYLPLLLQLHCVNDAFAQAVQSALSLGCILMIHVSEQLEMDVFMTLPGDKSGLKVQAFWKMDALIALCIRGRYCAQTQIQLLNCH